MFEAAIWVQPQMRLQWPRFSSEFAALLITYLLTCLLTVSANDYLKTSESGKEQVFFYCIKYVSLKFSRFSGYSATVGNRKMTTKSCKNGATTLSRMPLDTRLYSWMQCIQYYWVRFIFNSEVRVRARIRIRFVVWLVSGYAHVFVLLSVVIELDSRPSTSQTLHLW